MLNHQNIKNALTAGLMLFAIFLVYMVIRYEFNLSDVQILFSILGSASIGIALITYFDKKSQDITSSAIEVMSFFRKEVLLLNNDFMKDARNKMGQNYEFQRIKLDEPNINLVRAEFPDEIKSQLELRKDPDLFIEQTLILNILEEVALKIKLLNILNHPALKSIKSPFVELVEVHATVLLEQREILTGLPTYESVIFIYQIWKDEVDRRLPKERLTDFLKTDQIPK